jgi:hypothetical protein
MNILVNTNGIEPDSPDYHNKLAEGYDFLSGGLLATEIGIVDPLTVANRFDEEFYSGPGLKS